MAKLMAESAILFYAFVWIVSIVIFNMNIWGAYYPNQVWNSTTSSLEYVVPDESPSIFANMEEFNTTMGNYGNATNSSALNPGALTDVGALIGLVGMYFGFLTGILRSMGFGYLYLLTSYFIGPTWAWVINFIMTLFVILVAIKILTGRVRWE